MTVSTTINRREYTGDGVSTSFAFAYPVLLAADLKVYQAGTLKTLTTHYTLSGSAPYTSGTNVQFLSAPAVDDEIVILRDPAITQAVDISDNDNLPAASIETPLDRLTMICQRLRDQLDRSFILSDSDVSGASLTLPTPAANKLIGWDSDAMALANYASASIADTIVPSAFMETVLDDTSASAARTTLGAFASAGGTITGDTTVQGHVTLDTGKTLIFEGATADGFETTVSVTDPTADRAIVFQDGSGTVAFVADTVLPAGSIIQTKYTQSQALVTGAGTAIPYDNSIPQITEGDLFLTAPPTTPNNASNILRVTVHFNGTENTNTSSYLTVAIFRDSTADAVAAATRTVVDSPGDVPQGIALVCYVVAGSTSSTTFTVRAGLNTANPVSMNGVAGATLFGGKLTSSITVEEIKV